MSMRDNYLWTNVVEEAGYTWAPLPVKYTLPLSVLYEQAYNMMSLALPEQEETGVEILSIERVGAAWNRLGVRIQLVSYPSESARQVIYDVLGFCWDCHGSEGDPEKFPGVSTYAHNPSEVRRLYFTKAEYIYLRLCSHYEGPPRVIQHRADL